MLDRLESMKVRSFSRLVGGVIQRQIVNRGLLVSGLQAVFGVETRRQHVELQRADDADDGARAPSCGVKTCTTPSSASCCKASRNFLAFIASEMRIRRRISGAKLGTPRKTNVFALGERVADAQLPVVRQADDIARDTPRRRSSGRARRRTGAR